MKNFLQFIIPILVICLIGFIMLRGSRSETDDKKLYIKCNGKTKSFEVFGGTEIEYMKKGDECYLDIEVANVDRNYIKINTPYLWKLNIHGDIDETDAKNDIIIEIEEELVVYSYDKKTKFIFEYK